MKIQNPQLSFILFSSMIHFVNFRVPMFQEHKVECSIRCSTQKSNNLGDERGNFKVFENPVYSTFNFTYDQEQGLTGRLL